MSPSTLSHLLSEQIGHMPFQLQIAARFVLSHPKDVALMSMRRQARAAGVSHSTMKRLADWLGFEAYDELRGVYANVLGDSDGVSADLNGHLAQAISVDGNSILLPGESIPSNVQECEKQQVAVDILARARRLYSVGFRTELSVVSHFAYVLASFGRCVIQIDAEEIGLTPLRQAGPGDVMLAISTAPYARSTIGVARFAARRGIDVVAITDSCDSPLARFAQESVIVPPASHSFFQSIAPAIATVETIGTMLREQIDNSAPYAMAEA